MPSAHESRAALRLLTSAAVGTTVDLFGRLRGTPEARRLALLDTVPELIGYYSEGSAALAVDFYEDERDRAGVTTPYAAELVIADRTVKQRRGIAWAADPLFTGEDPALVESRLAEVVQLEVAKPYRDTITTNRRNDPESAGWRRVTSGGCAMCRMLADRGAVYRNTTARFAAHPNCHCGAEPVFRGAGEHGQEASVMQYVASQRNRTAAQKAELRKFLAENYGD